MKTPPKNYYFLANSLPPVELGAQPDLPFMDFCQMLQENLAPEDMHSVEIVRGFYDLHNLRFMWLNQPLDERGNYSAGEIDEAILQRDGFPEYVFAFLDRYDDDQSRIAHFSQLIQQYYVEQMGLADGFLRDYLAFEREWRLVFMGFRAKQLGRDLLVELQHEDPYDPLVAQLVAQKDAKFFEPPMGYEDLKPLFESQQDDPIGLHKALCEYRMRKVEEMIEGEQFSIDFVLGYLVQLIIVERWLELDQQEGHEIVDSIVKERL